ncbi:alpha-1,4-digalacturonate transport system substrate-binding protein [Kineococcus radiotolerans]|uniref:Alpha-1,4-digalacturonate transport system substrate-binding protein n=1 Tax=Kineococcus radiotolerans TaxID=131568 RepID=A0A7W4TN38_KINRA|nr:sugar ABC transporter substrate-binding protein [Kineococcus radiotolerans]MBB2901855.1 alpha-1,4-digalacturonate transport system substrate-binding protein [Kineococcus radiotolerans]
MIESTTSRRNVLLSSLAVAAGASGLAACGSGDSAGSGGDAKRITFWLSASEAQAAGYHDLAAAFEAAQGITVEIVNVPYDGYQTKLRQSAQANSLPDVASAPSLDPIWTGKLQDLTPVATNTANGIDEKLYQETSDGRILTIPSDITAAGLFINATLFQQAGVAHPTDPASTWTWDEFLAAAAQVRTAVGAKYSLVYDASPARIRAFVYQHGAKGFQLNEDGTEYSVDDATVEALQEFVDLNDDVVMPKSVWTSGADPNALFKSGQVVAYFSGVWQVADFAESISQFEWAAVPAPAQPTHATDINSGGKVVAFDNGDTKDAAMKFVEFLFDPANYAKVAATNGWLPVETGLDVQYPATNQAALDGYALYQREIELADPISTSGADAGEELTLAGKAITTDPTKDEMGKAINGQQTVQQAVDNIVKLLNEQIA